MAGFETIVRPVISPNIRPSAARKIASFADPEQGFAVIHGNPAQQINLTNTTSISISRSVGQEEQRRVDKVRVYQKQDDGTINKENFVDIEVTNRMRLKDSKDKFTRYYRRANALGLQPGEAGATNIELIEKDIIYNTKLGGSLGIG
jgi:hypothetical protein